MEQKRIAGEKAAEYIKDGMTVGLGTGSTAYYMVEAVGKLVAGGMKLRAVPTSRATEEQARGLGIPLVSIDKVEYLDLDIDGVDEIDPHFNAIKGGGGALFREKIVATSAKEVIWIMDNSKLKDSIGQFPLPVEILPYGYTHVLRQMETAGLHPVLRVRDGKTFVTDNGNYIADLHIGVPMQIDDVQATLKSMVGVLEIGLFLNMCKRIIVGTDNGVKVMENPNK